MTEHERLQERYEDALFALLMEDVAQAEGEKALEENERLRNDPAAAVPEEMTRQCLRTIRRHFTAQTFRSARQVAWKALKRVAVVALLGMALFTGAFAASDTFRANTMNLLIKTFGDHTQLNMENGTSAETNPQISAGWLPAGYVMTEQASDEVNSWATYQNTKGEKIDLIYTPGTGTMGVDTEDAQTSTIEIHGAQAMLIEKEGYHIVWGLPDGSAFIDVIGDGISMNDLIHVANEINP